MEFLANKLTILRKNHSYSQQDLADRLGIDIFEYMALENGRNKINDQQLELICSIYSVNIDNLLDENQYIEDISEEKQKETQQMLYDLFEQDNKKEKIINYRNIILIGISVIVLIIIVISCYLFSKDEPKEVLLAENKDKLLISNQYGVLYYDDEYIFKGQDINNQFNIEQKNISKILVNDDISVVLDIYGDIYLSGANRYLYSVDEFDNITNISIGDTHIIALDNNNNLHCTYSTELSAPCNFNQDFNNIIIKEVYAFGIHSIVIDEDNNYYLSEYLTSIKDFKDQNILDIISNKNSIYVLYEDKTVSTLSKTIYSEYKQWVDIDDLVILDDALIGLSNNKLLIESDNEIYHELTNIKDIYAISGSKDYIVIYTNDGIFGYGNNTFNIFEDIITKDNKIELEQASNIIVEILSDGISISFIGDNNAEYYTINVNDYDIDILSNKIVLDKKHFNENSNNIISIQAITNNDKYRNSKKTEYIYFYIPIEETVQPPIIELPTNTPNIDITPTPSNIPSHSPIPSVTPIISPTPTS